VRTRTQQVARSTSSIHCFATIDFVEPGQVVLGIVDCVSRGFRRGPTNASLGNCPCPSTEVFEEWQHTLGGAKGLQSIERGNVGSAKIGVHSRIREDARPARRANGQPKCQTFFLDSAFVGCKPWLQAPAIRIEQKRILLDLSRKQALAQAGNEYDVEVSPPSSFRVTDKHLSEPGPIG
jgi:hypothetical protein